MTILIGIFLTERWIIKYLMKVIFAYNTLEVIRQNSIMHTWIDSKLGQIQRVKAFETWSRIPCV